MKEKNTFKFEKTNVSAFADVLIDPNMLSKDGRVSLDPKANSWSENGKYLAY